MKWINKCQLKWILEQGKLLENRENVYLDKKCDTIICHSNHKHLCTKQQTYKLGKGGDDTAKKRDRQMHN